MKANQYITHFKKMKAPEEPMQNLYRNVEPLGDAHVYFNNPAGEDHAPHDAQRLQTDVE